MTDFLWATISTRPEPTSRAILFPGILWAYTRLVRFVLPSKGFVRFDEQAIVRHWGREHLYVLENEIRSFGRPLVETWRVRIGPLPLTQVIRIETRVKRGRWKKFIPGVMDLTIKTEIYGGIADIILRNYEEKKEEDDYVYEDENRNWNDDI